MSGADIFVIACIAAGLGFALRHIRKNKGGCGCGSCDGNCGSCGYRKE